jgi:hypothetical protein
LNIRRAARSDPANAEMWIAFCTAFGKIRRSQF